MTTPAEIAAVTVHHYAYVSTGKLSAMFTLWRGRAAPGLPFSDDNYVCNLAACGNYEDAERKAMDYCERMSERMGVTLHFQGFEDEPRNQRRGKLSVFQTQALEAIERGVWPFGKHKDAPISDAPDGYVLYFADKHADADPVVSVLAARCMGIALERDLIAKRDAARAERAALDAQSEFVGTVGERREFSGEILSSFYREMDADTDGYYITKIRVGADLLTYFGNKLGERGETIRFKATVKRHSEYQGVKSTQVNRPKLLG